VRLPDLPLHCCKYETLKCIGNILGRYIDKACPKEGMFSYARICVRVDLEKGIPEVVLLNLDSRKHKQPLDYEQLPFK